MERDRARCLLDYLLTQTTFLPFPIEAPRLPFYLPTGWGTLGMAETGRAVAANRRADRATSSDKFH